MGKARSINVIVESCKGLHSGKPLALSTNIILGVNLHWVTNTLAYYAKEFILNVKSFIVQSPFFAGIRHSKNNHWGPKKEVDNHN